MIASVGPRSTARIAGRPIHAMLVPIPIVCFIGTLITDIVYWRTADMLWSDMSAWLLVVGLLVAPFGECSTGTRPESFCARRLLKMRRL